MAVSDQPQSDSRPGVMPQPDAEALAHSEKLHGRLIERIKMDGGATGFDTFMQMALYETGLGYYVSGTQKFGESGDFVTAPELGKLFGQCLATQCAEILDAEGGRILEFGAGSGALAATLLSTLKAEGKAPDSYLIVEPSAELRERQRERLGLALGDDLSMVRWVDAPPAGFNGVMLANEVIDAMPVHRIRVDADGLKTLMVTHYAGDLHLDWRDIENLNTRERGYIQNLFDRLELPVGYETEVNLRAAPWIELVATSLSKGVLLVIDYGYPRDEYYLDDRRKGTLRCHYRHFAHDDVLLYPGLQDLTAHVDFTSLAIAADDHGLGVKGFTHQGAFLMNCGLLDLAAKASASSRSQTMALSREVMTLTDNAAMGESFKVMALARDYTGTLTGFSSHDRRHVL